MVCFEPSKDKVIWNFSGWKQNLVFVGAKVYVVDKFSYFGSCILPGNGMSVTVSSRRRTSLGFTNLTHLRRRDDIGLSVEGRI